MREAEQYAEQDKKKMEEAQLLNDADALLYTAEKTKTDLADKISQADVGRIDAAAKELRTAVEAKKADELKSKSEALKKVLQEVGTVVYQQAAQQAQASQAGGAAGAGASSAGPPPGTQGNGGATVTDADYKVVDEETK